jgi:hypothetical protein
VAPRVPGVRTLIESGPVAPRSSPWYRLVKEALGAAPFCTRQDFQEGINPRHSRRSFGRDPI